MKTKHVKFGSIEQFKNLCHIIGKTVRFDGFDAEGKPIYKQGEVDMPTLTLNGTVKIHGTNAGVRISKDDVKYQSRERDVQIQNDNAGFALWASQHKSKWLALGESILKSNPFAHYVIIFGEYAGGNIQKGVAVSQLPKMFVIFDIVAVCDDKSTPVSLPLTSIGPEMLPEQTYMITDFPTYQVECDFNNPHHAQNKIVELVEQVENECPVGKHFGVTGIGEGIVFTTEFNGKTLKFKAKGEKHTSSKIRKHVAVDIEEIESINKFIELFVTEARLVQGLDYMREMNYEMTYQNVKYFLQWINGDIIKEGHLEIVENQLDVKKISKQSMTKARNWYFKKLNEVLK